MSVLPGRPGCGCVSLSPTLDVFVSSERLGLQKRDYCYIVCFVRSHFGFKLELCAFHPSLTSLPLCKNQYEGVALEMDCTVICNTSKLEK